MPDPLAFPVAQAALAQLMLQLAATAKGQPQHARITPGDTVVAALTPTSDECCEGIASVRIGRVFPTNEFPAEDSTPATGGGPITYAVELELQVIRCGTQPGQNMAPTDGQLTADAQTQMDDAAAMRRSAPALLASGVVYDYVIGLYQPTSADGGCLGGMMVLTVQVDCAET